ncbi:hypothetical protein B0H67DRAFT_172243 [Lasiosphaeris hirsuta]|uniref:Uncharacterized protein n=1 Tax=Lasiosphaeris hirsuta TaxID=260670 RepID=A0AA40AQ92_9PEZI|nr:hypothetical protein B0H67DRAFT_172243 [Lasiosphaeris hirsuta]
MSRLVEKDQGPLATAIPVDTPTVRQAGILDVVTQAEQENQSQRPSGESPHIPLTQRNQAPVSSSHGLSNHSSAISPQARSVGSLPPAKQPLKHRYSFIEGDDGLVLTIPHVSAAQESQKKSKLWQKGSSRSDSGLDPLSTSFNSVIWLGADDRHMSLADRGQESASSSVSSETTTQRDLEGATTGEDLTQHPTAALLTPGSKKATVTEVADFGSRSVLFSDGKLGTHTVTVSAVEEKPELEMETTVPLGANMAPLLSLNKPKSPSKSRSVTRLGTGETMSNVARIAAARAVSRADNPHGGSGPLDG